MNSNNSSKRIIHSKDIEYSYHQGNDKTDIFKNVSFTISHGEFVAVVGPSGSGKTTLLTIIGGLKSMQGGQLEVLGKDLSRANLEELNSLRSSISFIFQAPHLMEFLTATQNVQMSIEREGKGTFSSRERICKNLINEVGLEGKGKNYPSMLSRGQKQRVSLARALARSPKLILADEPTASLDRNTASEMIQLIKNLANQRDLTVLMTTHDPFIMDMADRVLSINFDGITELPNNSFR